ncbi:hypothetical protein [Litoreibacter ponti]|nr:hypothetical protein [Litoreibacter ponti]
MTYAALALSLGASQAAALSCLRPDPVAAFKTVAEADQTFFIVNGQFAFDTAGIPDPFKGPPQEVAVDATFRGKLLTSEGFTEDVQAPVTINLDCAGPWCARMSPNTDYMAFVLRTDTGLIFNVDPCYSFAFPNPKADAIKAVEQCAAGGECEVKKEDG